MPEFLELLPPAEALAKLLENFTPSVNFETVSVEDALGRLTVETILAPHPLPSFPRTTVDGYAVLSRDTYGASESLPTYLQVIGEVPMGAAAEFSISNNECALIHTGGMLPQGADAVVMVEHTQSVRLNEVEVLRSVAVGENVIRVGEDVEKGQEVILPGTRLRAAEIGGLMALGMTQVSVAKKPRVGIISSGDEVIPPVAELGPGQVRDVNAYTLSALVEETGGIPVRYGIISDQERALYEVAVRALNECAAVVITAGSSASTRDLTAQVINQLGQPGVLVHGVNVRPGKPTILAVCTGKPVIGLPGNPVSALVIASLFVRPVLEVLLGLRKPKIRAQVPASLTVNLASQTGREDWIPVRLLDTEQGYSADPIFGKSNLIFNLAKADGLVRIPADANGLAAGEIVEVHLM